MSKKNQAIKASMVKQSGIPTPAFADASVKDASNPRNQAESKSKVNEVELVKVPDKPSPQVAGTSEAAIPQASPIALSADLLALKDRAKAALQAKLAERKAKKAEKKQPSVKSIENKFLREFKAALLLNDDDAITACMVNSGLSETRMGELICEVESKPLAAIKARSTACVNKHGESNMGRGDLIKQVVKFIEFLRSHIDLVPQSGLIDFPRLIAEIEPILKREFADCEQWVNDATGKKLTIKQAIDRAYGFPLHSFESSFFQSAKIGVSAIDFSRQLHEGEHEIRCELKPEYLGIDTDAYKAFSILQASGLLKHWFTYEGLNEKNGMKRRKVCQYMQFDKPTLKASQTKIK